MGQSAIPSWMPWSLGSKHGEGEMRHREVKQLTQGHTAKNLDASWEQRLGWIPGASADGTAALVPYSPGRWAQVQACSPGKWTSFPVRRAGRGTGHGVTRLYQLRAGRALCGVLQPLQGPLCLAHPPWSTPTPFSQAVHLLSFLLNFKGPHKTCNHGSSGL